RAEQPDLVLMDVVLPGMNGFQATRALSRDAATSAIPVLIVSTKGMETDKAWGMRQGARGYVVKPPVEADLIERINALLGGCSGRRRPPVRVAVRGPRGFRAAQPGARGRPAGAARRAGPVAWRRLPRRPAAAGLGLWRSGGDPAA